MTSDTSTAIFPERPFASTELAVLGIDRRALREALTHGILRSPCRAVYLLATLPDSHETRAAALALVTSEHHVICDRTAAWLHGIDVFSQAEWARPPDVEICALRGHTPTRLAGADARTRDLAPNDIMTIHGVSVTTPLRTAIDLGCHLRRREAMAALNVFARKHGVTADQIAAELRRLRGRRGIRQLRDLISLMTPVIESQRESWVWLEIHDHGLPMPEPQHWIEVGGVPAYRLDFAYPRARICVEYDGVDFHDKTSEQREADAVRRRWLREHGWTIIVVRVGDFTGTALDRWISDLRDQLRPSYSTRRF